MRYLTLRHGRPPLEVVGDEMVLLAVEHRRQLVLGDEQFLVRLESLGELVERDAHLGTDVGHQIRIEQQWLGRPT